MRYKTDKEWEAWGKTQPWYGVLSENQYQGSTLSKEAKQQFYDTGNTHVQGVLALIREVDPKFKPKHVVDFGCGTGRLLFAFARTAKHATGIDVSKSMLQQAKKHQPKNIKNISYLLSDGTIRPSETYDLVHSIIVFQHMKPHRGYEITDGLLRDLKPGGFAALHYTVYDDSLQLVKVVRWARRKSKLVNYAVNFYKRRPIRTPNMQMNMYDLGKLVKIFHDNGISDIRMLSNHPDCYVGTTLVGRKG